jgi:hypothetical protein
MALEKVILDKNSLSIFLKNPFEMQKDLHL